LRVVAGEDTGATAFPLYQGYGIFNGCFCYQNLVTLIKFEIMGKNTSVSLGDHFEDFVEQSIEQGRYNNASEVIRAGLRLLEEEESRFNALKSAIQEGLDSGFIPFDANAHLKAMKTRKKDA
jgi:antitoxin ParD1/3/4